MSQLDWITQEELNYLMKQEYKAIFPGLAEDINTPRYTIKDLGITHRDATYWDKKDILPRLKTTNTARRKYTLKQAVWIKLIQQLRSFDISLNQIRKYKENILGNEVNVSELLEQDKILQVIEQISLQNGQLDKFRELIKTKEFHEQIKKETFDFFEMILLTVIVLRHDMSYITLSDGSCFPYRYDKHDQLVEKIENLDQVFKAAHLVLSISQAISQLITNWAVKNWAYDLTMLTVEERKILTLLRENKIKELRIFKNDNTIDRLVLVSKDNTIETINEVSKCVLTNGYQTITVKLRNGKVVHLINEISLKLNK